MEHNTDRILWTVLVLAIGVALFVILKPAANSLLGQTTEKIQTVVGGINNDTSDNSSSSSSNSSNNTANVGTNLYTDTQNFNNLAAWNGSSYWKKTTDTYKGLAVMQTTQDGNGLSQRINAKKGDVLTYSAYVRYTSGTGTGHIYWVPDKSYSNTVTITNSWQRVSGSAGVNGAGYFLPRLERSNGSTSTLQIAGIKVEKGSVSTPYTP